MVLQGNSLWPLLLVSDQGSHPLKISLKARSTIAIYISLFRCLEMLHLGNVLVQLVSQKHSKMRHESLPLFPTFVMIAYKMHYEDGNVQIALANIRLSSQMSDFLILILFFSFALLHLASFHIQSPHKNEWWLTQVSYYYLVTKAAISDNCKLVKIIFS